MILYLDLLARVMEEGADRLDRTGVGSRSLFGERLCFDLRQGFPLLTTKRIHMKSVIYELLWFLSGQSNIAYLQDKGVRIWDEWADERGDLGPIYGKQWRSWRLDGRLNGQDSKAQAIDQIAEVIDELKRNPFSRRLVVSAWNVGELQDMALPPCHCLFQFYAQDGYLSCQLYQRSADIFLGVPFNIASYALLTHMMAQVVGLKAGRFIHIFGDVHLYHNHFEQAREQLRRQPTRLPRLRLDENIKDIFSFDYDHIVVEDYHPQKMIKAKVAI